MPGRVNLLRAGATLWLSMYRRSKAALAALLVRPYLVLLFMIALGNSESIALKALLSLLVTSAVDALWDIAGGAVNRRLMGILPYEVLAPYSLPEVLLLTYLPRYLLETLLKFAELAPLMVLGGATPLQLAAALALGLLGALPLASIGMLLASLTLLAKEDAPWIDWTIPLLLILSGAVYPVTALPGLVRAVSALLPTTYLFELAEAAARGGSDWPLLLAALFATASASWTASLGVSRGIERVTVRRGGHL